MIILHNVLYFKLPYLPFSNFAQRKVRTLIKKYCSNLTIKLAFGSFKVKNLIKVKDSVPRSLRSRVVYKFTCAGCISVYVGETCRHISIFSLFELFFASPSIDFTTFISVFYLAI